MKNHCNLIIAISSLAFCSFCKAETKTPTLDFALLAKTTTTGGVSAFPEELKKFEDQKVRVTGFVAPYDDPDKMSKIMLTGQAFGCFYCNPPHENSVVFVRFAKGAKAISLEVESVTVQGILHLQGNKNNNEESQNFLFTVDDAVVAEKK